MQRIGNLIDLNSSTTKTKKNPFDISADDVDKVMAWHKIIEGVYNCKPLPTEGVVAWVATLGHCKKPIMDQVVAHWIREERLAPKPSDLLGLYREFFSTHASEHKLNKLYDDDNPCPYCLNCGWVRIYYTSDPTDTYNSGVVGCSCDKNTGWIQKFLQDDKYEWNEKGRGFITKWVGSKASL